MQFRFAPGAKRYAVIAAAIGVIGVVLSPIGLLLVPGLGLFVLWFYRDPDREPPAEGIISPADGRVSVIREENDRIRLGVFMNVTDVHVNRAPIDGTVGTVDHTAGAHRPAFTKDSERNERVRIEFEEALTVVQIAGAFARRITPYVAAGDSLDRGDRIGHIAFGSRVDVLFPPDVSQDAIEVSKGDAVRAGETVIATRP
ncbi:MAG: protein sorting system archaetidylserine decarboxylase [Halobacteriales archaeon]|nr:protein sorting system archaetidylserine decarboxylase [Halobacteriales archaeon]